MAIDQASIPLIVGLIGVLVAVLERGYKRYLEEKKLNPELKFDGAYMLNLLVSAGIGTALVATVIPALITAVQGQVPTEVTVASLFLNFILGYTTTYRILDAMNTSTDNKLAENKPVPTTNTNTPPT